MRQEDILAAAIGVKLPWKTTSVNLEIVKGKLVPARKPITNYNSIHYC